MQSAVPHFLSDLRRGRALCSSGSAPFRSAAFHRRAPFPFRPAFCFLPVQVFVSCNPLPSPLATCFFDLDATAALAAWQGSTRSTPRPSMSKSNSMESPRSGGGRSIELKESRSVAADDANRGVCGAGSAKGLNEGEKEVVEGGVNELKGRRWSVPREKGVLGTKIRYFS